MRVLTLGRNVSRERDSDATSNLYMCLIFKLILFLSYRSYDKPHQVGLRQK